MIRQMLRYTRKVQVDKPWFIEHLGRTAKAADELEIPCRRPGIFKSETGPKTFDITPCSSATGR